MATPVEWSAPFQVNTGTAATGFQSQPKIVGLIGGGFVVAWQEQADGLIGTAAGTDIIAKIYDAEGNVLVDSFQLNSVWQVDDERDFDLTATATGFAIAYIDDSLSGTAIAARQESFDFDGNPISSDGVAFAATGTPEPSSPRITSNLTASNDDIFVAFNSDNGTDEDILARIIDETGTNNGNFQAAQNGADYDRLGDAVVLSNGDFVTVYSEEDGANNSLELYIMDENGVGGPAQAISGIGFDPNVASLAGDGFVVTYTFNNDVFVTIFDNSGANILTVPVATGPDNQNEPDVIGLPDGDFVVFWDNDTVGDIRGQRFNPDGTTDGGVFIIDDAGGGLTQLDIDVTADGRILFAYIDTSGELTAAIWDPRPTTIDPDDYATETANFTTTDTITTSKDGSTVLAASSGFKIILGQEGDDTINSNGAGEYYGGAGDDFIAAGLGSSETLDGGLGFDTLETESFSGDYDVNLETGQTNFSLFGESFTNFENVFTGSGDDTITGTSGANRILTRDGNDVVTSGNGNDTISTGAGDDIVNATNTSGLNLVFGGDGNDTITSTGEDTVFGGDGDDSIFAGLGTAEQLDGQGGIDTLDTTLFNGNYVVDLASGMTNFAPELFLNFENLVLGNGSDEGFGTAGANLMRGNGGADRLLGLGGNDNLQGDGGNDTLNGGDGNDLLNGGANEDSIYAGTGNDTLVGGSGNDRLEGQLGSDQLNGDGGNDTLRASDGNDTVIGGDGNDLGFGGNQNDLMIGGLGNDTLDGSSGDDTIFGSEGDDILVGETGLDSINGGSGNDTIRGGGGNDSIDGDPGDDLIFGSSGDDTIFGGTGNDVIEGNQQADFLLGQDGNDTLRGGDGFDQLEGGDGNDVLSGGNGNDQLRGADGIDILRGNAGADTFDFDFVSQSSFGASDLIEGFDGAGAAGGDIIDLSTIDADATTAFNDTFAFLGVQSAAAGIGAGAGSLWVQNVGGQTWLRGIVNNDAVIDLEVRIADGATVAGDYIAGDFFL